MPSSAAQSPSSVHAATLVAPHQLEVRSYPYPAEVEPGAILLRILASGICGTDKHTFRGENQQYVGTEYERTTPFPIVQGHENVGVVAALGDGGAIAFDGTPLNLGDRLVPAPNRACGRCHMCLRGFPYYLCRALENYGNSLTSAQPPHLFGGWSEYLYLRPGTAVFRVPPELPDDVAVLTEIFAVTHSLERAARLPRPNGFRPGDSVGVIGVGPLGLAHAIKASLMGAGHVLVVDPSARRRALAARLANAIALPSGPETAGEVRARCGGEGADVVINATGFPGSFAEAMGMVRDGGTIIEVGAFVDMGDEAFNPAALCGRSLTLLGVGGEDLRCYEGTLSLLARHYRSVPFADMVSHRFEIADAPEAMNVALDAEASAKVLITPGRGHESSPAVPVGD
jgi:threonine dehydrogenase-like Zn-dependent dehydrogenase